MSIMYNCCEVTVSIAPMTFQVPFRPKQSKTRTFKIDSEKQKTTVYGFINIKKYIMKMAKDNEID